MSYSPEFTGPIQGWIVNQNKKHCWRVEGSMTFDDLNQEAYLIFMRCAEKYPNVETPQHFMALFKTSWSNHFIDLANKDTAGRFITGMPQVVSPDDGVVEYEVMGDHDNDGYLSVLLRQAPEEIKMVITIFLSAPQELLDLALASWNGTDKRCKAGGSKKVCQLLGLPPTLDVLKMTEEYFTKGQQ